MRSFKTDTIKQSRRQAELDQYAWRNRRVMTASEAALWAELRGSKLGVAFRRQVPLCGRYIVDFCAPAVRLVVEVDGGYHALRGRADAQRDRELGRWGYRVVRISATVVMRDVRVAVEGVRDELPLRLPTRPRQAIDSGEQSFGIAEQPVGGSEIVAPVEGAGGDEGLAGGGGRVA